MPAALAGRAAGGRAAGALDDVEKVLIRSGACAVSGAEAADCGAVRPEDREVVWA
jgi:hypothetical protein